MDRQPRRLAVGWSGGKDSAMALARLREQGVVVETLITTVTEEYDRVSIHGVRRSLLHRQALALGLPLTEVVLPPNPSNEVYERCFADTVGPLAGRIDGVAFGDLFLEDVRAYRERQMASLDLTPVFPIWGEPTDRLAHRWVEAGFLATVCVVDTTQLDGALAGSRYDQSFLAALPAGVDPCGERGEFHTFVHAGPGFGVSIPIGLGERVLRDERFMFCDLLEQDGASDE